MILQNLELVEKVAARVARRMPPWIEMAELVSLGNVGLVEAAGRFDAALHASFAVYAMLRIRGAMIDGYRGRNYPRLMESMPEAWLQGSNEDDDLQSMSRTPAQLISDDSVLESLIEREQSVVVCIDAVRARQQLNETEGRVFDHHVNGTSMRDIGSLEGRSGAWSHYVVHRARKKMRATLGVIDGGKKAA